jgi:ParB/RepB/Spo0J family partition protein
MDSHAAGSGGAQAYLAGRAVAREVDGPAPLVPELSPLAALLDGAGRMFEVPLERLRRDPAQPRKEFDERELKDLAVNMKLLGQLQPAVVRPVPEEPGQYMIVMGERRWRAAELAGLATLQCILRDEDARLVPAKQWAENHFRSDLSAIEEAGAMKSVMELEQLDVPGFAARYGISERMLRRYLQLLGAPVWIQAAVVKGEQIQIGDTTELRKLDLTGAVELQRTFNTYLRQEEAAAKAAAKDAKGLVRALAAAARKAQHKAEGVKRRALRETWSRRRWQDFASAAAQPLVAEPPTEDGREQDAIFEASATRLVVHLDRIAGGGPAELERLASRLSQVLAQVRNEERSSTVVQTSAGAPGPSALPGDRT